MTELDWKAEARKWEARAKRQRHAARAWSDALTATKRTLELGEITDALGAIEVLRYYIGKAEQQLKEKQ